jgi:hypothetical protein
MDAKIEQWQEVISQWRESGQTQKDFLSDPGYQAFNPALLDEAGQKDIDRPGSAARLGPHSPTGHLRRFDGNHHRDRPAIRHPN